MNFMPATAAAAVLALCACSSAEEPAAPPPPAPAAEAPPTAVSQPGLSWGTASSGEGIALILSDAAGAPLLRLGCIRNPAVMTLAIEGFTAIGSEERLTVGLDDHLFVFVADATARGPGVKAQADISTDFLDRLEDATAIRAVYGDQELGPHVPPPAGIAAGFAAECRRAVSVS
ncbi:hypothetical protein [Phenylobacterium sp.]|uniref:hypothetical protein n=1 Tax=Phenylobacterium sp. TaxID=1871053 RepID=UPI002731FECA|nr:hypothetical protein [Phenylobacterium sp.]MDP1616815.1 hypothetical protein [Phenylobacterium sp.]MDP1988128.1 hypothetical protein [Phenylobacterium sp.]